MPPETPVAAFPAGDHDHRACVASALRRADELARRRGARFTALRRRVLKLVWASHKPVGAYALLEALQREGRAAPPTVYRALDFLQNLGLVHRLASLNAYVGCPRPDTPHAGQFLICQSCQNLVELDDREVQQALERSSLAAGFRIARQTVEVIGLCPQCR